MDLSDYSQIAANFFTTVSGCQATASPDPTPPPINNLLSNPSFESGTTGWDSLTSSMIQSQVAQDGSNAVRIQSSTQVSSSGWKSVQAGKTYIVSGWFRWESFGNTDWGNNSIGVTNSSWQTVAVKHNLHQAYPKGEWHKVAMSFTPTANTSVRVDFGVFGPQSNIDLYYDNFLFFEKTGNLAPVINPQASPTSGAAPLTVNFTANGDDYDGAIEVYQWEFGDGTESRDANPSHTYLSPGTYTATLNAYDNDGAKSSKSVTITVTDNTAPTVNITSPSNQAEYTTSGSSVTLSGSSSTPQGQIGSIVWDNVNTGEAKAVSVTSASSVSWNAGTLNLKPGRNEILVTAKTSGGRTATDRIIVNRSVSGPSVSGVSVNTTSPRVYEKYEATFNVATVAEYPMFMYDPNPPAGVERYSGVTVEGVITKPNGQQVTHPAFYMNPVNIVSSSNLVESNNQVWKLRFAPQQTGTHQVAIRVTDKSGSTTTQVGSFNAQSPVRPGYIKVASGDKRYFEYTNGQIHFPIGMTWTGSTIPESGSAPSVINYDRPWMGGRQAYTTRWSNWYSSALPTWGNEGAIPNLSYTDHYPSSELSMVMKYPEGWRMWIGWLATGKTRINPSTTYEIKLRLKTVNIQGPRQSGPPWGLVIKTNGWISIDQAPDQDSGFLSDVSWIPPITGTNDWSTHIFRYTTPSNYNTLKTDFSLALQNVTSGEVYIDQFSVRPVNADGTLGGEMVLHSRADWHTYVDQRPMATFDQEVERGEQNGINLRYVVHDKNDLIQNMLHARTGLFVGEGLGNGYYQPENTKATWLLKQWYRYLVARLGYSTAVFGWELNNEGPPDDGTSTHARSTQIMGRWMHELDAHPHLANTSFWCCWRPTFWKDSVNFPDVDFADIHRYASSNDMVAFHLEDAADVVSGNVGKPVVMGERGIENMSDTAARNGVWYHNMLWSQLHHSALFEIGYWFSSHANGFSRTSHAIPFANFVNNLDLHQGGYQDLAASSNQAKFRVMGQKNLAKNKAHGWINHSDHTWSKVASSGVPTAVSGSVTFTMNPNRTYTVSWYNTYTGQTVSTQQVSSNSSGSLTIQADSIDRDIAFKLE